MSTSLTNAQVLALAPDPGSAKSAAALATPRSWVSTGRSERAAWGECKGSGKEPYRTQVDLAEPAFRCSCPSRKFPCKHGLGLLLLLADQPAAVPEAVPPPWVLEWLATREKAAQRRVEQREAADDPETLRKRAAQQARSAERREANVAAGVAELDRWLRDQLRGGLADLQARSPAAFDAVAARMTDAQAPGLARRLREAASLPASGMGWQSRLLERLASLALLAAAYPRLAELHPDTQADIRAAVGFTQSQEDLLGGPALRDRWAVLGQQLEEDERVTTQRTWLLGLDSGSSALILEFSAGNEPLPRSLIPGTVIDAELVFFPGSLPLRALIRQRHATPGPLGTLPAADSVAATAPFAAALARNPWLDALPLVVGPAGLAHAGDGRWLVVDAAGRSLPLARSFEGAWGLLARSGGQPFTLCGVWNGQALAPLGALIAGSYVTF